MKPASTARAYEIWLFGALAGAAGGLAEILWIGLYGAVTGNDMAVVARSIAAVVGAALPFSPVMNAPVPSGIAIHMFAAVVLGLALTLTWHAISLRTSIAGNEYQLLPTALAMIWAFNFFVLLPLISPHFADLQRSFTGIIPYPVSLFSKLLFGLAAAAVIKRKTRAQLVLIRA